MKKLLPLKDIPDGALADDGHGPSGYTRHGAKRSAQRNLSDADVRYVLRFGSWSRTVGREVVVLRRRDIPEEQLADSNIARLAGSVVLIARNGRVITVLRGERPIAIRKFWKSMANGRRPRPAAA